MSGPLDFFGGASVGTPPPPPDAPPSSTDPVCDVCGLPLLYSGRGRRPTKCEEHRRSSPGSGSRSSSGTVSTKDLDMACETLHSLYEDVILTPLSAVSPMAGQTWAAQIEGLDKRNRMFLSNNRDLVKKINSTAAKGGTVAFTLSHLIAVAPVVLVLMGQYRAVRAQAAAEAYAAQPDAQVYDMPEPSTQGETPWTDGTDDAPIGGVGQRFFE